MTIGRGKTLFNFAERCALGLASLALAVVVGLVAL